METFTSKPQVKFFRCGLDEWGGRENKNKVEYVLSIELQSFLLLFRSITQCKLLCELSFSDCLVGSTMVSSVLWISAQVLAFTCLLIPSSGYLVLREGDKCGDYIEGACEKGLVCVSTEPSSTFYAVGVCSRVPTCNCSEYECPPWRRGEYCSPVMDPCGCCSHCAKGEGQVCGGPSWRYGNCDWRTICSLVVGLDSVRAPQIGVCKELPSHLENTFSQPPCSVRYGCNVHVGNCDCYSEDSCQAVFRYSTYDACDKVLMADRMYDSEAQKNDPEPEEPKRECTEWGCEVQGCECVCQHRKCDSMKPPLYETACCNILRESGCQNATCPEIPPPPCPADSFISQPYTEPGQCCPVVPPMCTCNFKTCAPKPKYCDGGYPRLVEKGNGHPGSCCDRYECVKEEN
ncbi:cysteine-rich motor neuron 1 protein-like isoform X1 [Hemibagrus wyckioides]|uniref:cysteine-rich motor neuron 1 protein-like isoform X1 n=1 Tax=Hemibagrus wyckioides TaxID=337641 RepID=UPI00266C5256|nr:cysteine-rich motor neuron 1 protein-like isoform X1 [Hemibagrus wyckioides]